MLKIIIRIGLVTALVIIAFEAANQMLIYKYIKFEYYLGVVAIAALVTGILIAKKTNNNTVMDVQSVNNPCTSLTNKELHILSLISQGKSNKEIAALNFVELSTIKTHINNLYGKLGVNNRKDAVALYYQYNEEYKSTLYPPQTI